MENPNCETFVFCPSCGQKALFSRSPKSFKCRECGFLFYLNCAAAAMALIFDDQGRLLITYRKKEPAKGKGDLPGGFVEPGETVEQGLTREIKEELNLDVLSLEYLCSAANFYPYASVTYPITDMAFICKTNGFDQISANDDITGFEFVDLSCFDLNTFGMASPKRVVEFYCHRFGIK